MSDKATQTSRILEALLKFQGKEVPVLVLHVAGSGKEMGFVASMSRRISDCRALGHHITCRKETVNEQVHSFYTLRPKPMPQAQALAEIKSIYGNGVKVEFST